MQTWRFSLRNLLLFMTACAWLVASFVHDLLGEGIILLWACMALGQKVRPLQVVLATLVMLTAGLAMCTFPYWFLGIE
jgi:hypothetical protein